MPAGADPEWLRILAEQRVPAKDQKDGSMKVIRLVEARGKYPLRRVVDLMQVNAKTGKQRRLQRSTMVADHVMVKLAPGATEAMLKAASETIGGGIRRKMRAPRLYLVRIPATRIEDFEEALSGLEKSAGVVGYAEPDYMTRPCATPNDPRFSEQWGLHNTGQLEGAVVGSDINAPEAWDIHTGSRDVLVAVIDSGINPNHPDLAANMWKNPGEIGLDSSGNDKKSNGVDDDNNGYVDDWQGWDFYDDDNDPNPGATGYNHGTVVAGVIGAVGNNGIGITGVCWEVSLVNINVGLRTGWISAGIEGIYYTSNLGVKVTNNSYRSDFSQGMYDAIADAKAKGILFVAAAGNERWDNDEKPFYPASYDHDNIISVNSACRHNRWGHPDHCHHGTSVSNYGLTSVDLAAPGALVLTTDYRGGYKRGSGTSGASPHVAGACALLASYKPSASYQEIKQAIMDSVTPLPDLSGVTVTGGRLNLYGALLRMSHDSEPPVLAATNFSLSGTASPDATSVLVDGIEALNSNNQTWQRLIPYTGTNQNVPVKVTNTNGQENHFQILIQP